MYIGMQTLRRQSSTAQDSAEREMTVIIMHCEQSQTTYGEMK